MATITVGTENSTPIELYYEDHGSGKPVVLIHGWPLNGAAWGRQVTPLLAAGHRVITYDRRGFGSSSQPSTGYDYDTFAADLEAVLAHLDLKDAAIVGHSMGTGEVARYLGKYGSKRIRKAVLISAIPPFLLKTADNPEGVDASVFKGMEDSLAADRPAFLLEFLKNFYNFDVLSGTKISEPAMRSSWATGIRASAKGTFDCVSSWLEDFRGDLAKIDIPTLVIHGDADRILPHANTAARLPKLIKGTKLVTVEGAPHGLLWTHADDVNRELLAFLA